MTWAVVGGCVFLVLVVVVAVARAGRYDAWAVEVEQPEAAR